MQWHNIQKYPAGKFRRYTGVNRKVFDLMLDALRAQKSACRKSTGGRKPLLDTEDQLLLMLLYYREYRTMFHLGASFGLSESRVCTLIARTEVLLLKDKRFHLAGKKVLLCNFANADENAKQVAIIDATECEVERPKKSKAGITQAKRSVIR